MQEGLKMLSPEEAAAKYGDAVLGEPIPAVPGMPPVTPAAEEEVEKPIIEASAAPAPAPAPVQNATPSPKEILGDGPDSWDEVKSRLTRLSELEPKIAEYETKVQELSPADPYVAELNKALKKGISREAFNEFYSSNPEELKPEQLVSLQYQLRDGLTKEEADFLVAERYKLGEFKDLYEEGAPELKLAGITLKQDANAAKSFIDSHRAEIMTSPYEKAVQERVKEFEPIVPAILNEISTVKAGEFTYNMPKETIEKAKGHLNALLQSDMLDMDKATPENIKQLKDIAYGQAIATEFENIVKFIATEYDKKILTEKVNPRPVTGVDAPKPVASEKDKQMAMANAFNSFG